jgi:diguanylate cyclase (GGDEF)-like protein/PAS domain S-box-containing protein
MPGVNEEREILRLSQFLSIVVEHAKMSVIALDENFNVVIFNQAAAEMSGYGPEEIIGHSRIFEYFFPDKEYRKTIQERAASVVQGTRLDEFETVVRTKSGEEKLISWYARALTDESGRGVGAMGLGLDITSRKKAEQELERSVSLLRATLEAVANGIFVVDHDGKIAAYNQRLLEMWGIPEHLLKDGSGRQVAEYVADAVKDPDRFMTRINQFYENPDIEYRDTIFLKDGRTIERYSRPQFIGGKSAGRVLSFHDVSELRKTYDSLRQQEKEYRIIFDSVPALIWYKDTENRILRLNEPAARYLGMKVKDIEGKSTYDLYPEFAQKYHEDDLEVIRSGRPKLGIVEQMETSNGGGYRWVQTDKFPYLNEHGEIVGVLVFAMDITERKRAEEATRETAERYALAALGANDGLWDWDLKTNEIYFSPRWKAMLGFSDEIGESPEEWFNRIHPDDRFRFDGELRAHLGGETPHFMVESRMKHRDGGYRWMLTRGIAVPDEKGQPWRMAGSQTDITERKMAEQRLQHEAIHDVLTGLPNRALFMDLLGRSLGRSRRKTDYLFAVLFLDLDRFKMINDSLGHLIGDQLLIAMARRLERCLRPGDVVARLGGDEFTILLDDIKDVNDATRIADRIQNELKQPFQLGGQEVFTTASIGIALSASGYERPDDLLRDSDTAMYRAKAMGKACHQVFDSAMHSRAVALLQLETDLRRAMERNEFVLYYQPTVCLRSGRIHGVEALIRWQHPERGLVLPDDFIPHAEETGLIIPIGNWVLEEACKKMREWHRHFPHLTISVNLSVKQFTQSQLSLQVQNTLYETGLNPNCLMIEITESMLMENPESTATVLEQLKRLDVKIHIDDFGTGYSSLSYLHRFPIDTLKIDRSFVSRMAAVNENLEIVRTIVTLAHNLGMDVIAEGVETAEQLAQLRALKCERAQGYYFSEPVDAHQVSRLFGTKPLWIDKR